MKRTSHAFYIVWALLTVLPAHAVQLTMGSPGDRRVRFVEYDPHNVVTIYSRVGTDTLVLFEQGEKVRDLSGGDTDAWGVGVTTAGNGFFIKPKVTSPSTNIHVITDKRVYSIDMKLARKGRANYLTVWYRYPADEAAARALVENRTATRARLNNNDSANATNRHYSVQGSDDLTPYETWDDGIATYFRFSAHRIPPAVYAVSEDSAEHLVNFNTTPNGTLIIHSVARKFVFRSGSLVTCVFNESYNATGTRPLTNTVSPNVERILKSGAAQ